MNETKLEISAAQRSAYYSALARFGTRPEVTGVDIGFRWQGGERTDEVCVRLHVREKFHEADAVAPAQLLPPSIDDVRVDVLQGVYAPHERLGTYESDPSRRQRADQIQPGLSIGPRGGGTGTLGLIVKDASTDDLSVLSCAHVLASKRYPRPGDRILQPASADGGRKRDTIGRLSRYDIAGDWALARLNDKRSWQAEQYRASVTVTGSRWPVLGDVLEKSGRTTSVTTGIVDGIGSYMGLSSAFRLVPLDPHQDVEISHTGDSGAVWYDAGSGAGVGLHSKGEVHQAPGNEFAIATMLRLLVANNEIRIP